MPRALSDKLRGKEDSQWEKAVWNKQKPAELPGTGLGQLKDLKSKTKHLQTVELPVGRECAPVPS